jgi:hypothetical protein
MSSATFGERSTGRLRIAGWCVALLIEALILFALLSLGQYRGGPPASDRSLSTFNLGQEAAQKPQRKEAAKREKPKARVTTPQKPVQNPPPPTPPVKSLAVPSPNKGIVEISKEDLAAGDISKLGSKSSSSASASAGGKSGGIMGPGEGPGGKPLYNAEWVREPTDSELAPYLAEAKARPLGAWAMVACRTIPNNRVDNCQSLGESPPGTGLAKALRLASWQFLVRPPRDGNKPLLGVWVRIRFDFSKAAKEG